MSPLSLHIVLTGATRGLGYAMAQAMAGLGHTVSGCGSSEALINQLNRKSLPGSHFSAVDVSSEPAVARWAETVLRKIGPPDFLINNAAIINDPKNLWEIGGAEFDRMMDVNIKGVAHVIRHFVPAMVERSSGVIVNLSSGCGRAPFAKLAPYCATKYAIEGLSQSMAEELPPGMACVALSPGVINTDMLRKSWGASALAHVDPATWARSAVPYILGLGPKHNGASLRCPD